MMRNYTCPRCRNTCRCGQKRPASVTLIWPVVVLSGFVLIGIIAGIKELAHAFTKDPSLWAFPGLAVVAVVGYVLIMANSPEIRDRERQG